MSWGGRARRQGASQEEGTATAEIAIALPALTLLLAGILGVASVGASQLRLEEAARAGAREIMRGERDESVDRTVRRIAGEDVQLALAAEDGWTVLEVSATARGPLVGLMAIPLTATAHARPEDAP